MALRLKPLAEQAVVVTGASSGIGLVTARAAAKAGAKVLLVARDGEALAQAAQSIRDAGGEADHAVADIGDAGAVAAAAARAVERFGRIDTWVNAAGVTIYARLLDTPADAHERMFRTNYFGTVNAVEVAVPHLSEQGGAFIAVASIASDVASPIMGAYAASKHAVQAYLRALRIELRMAGAPVSVTIVKPAGIDTPIAQHALNREGGEAQIPPPVYAPELVAAAILAAAVRPRREITVGGAGRAQALFATAFPALFERLAPLAARSFVDRNRTQPGPDALDAPADEGCERSGEHAPREVSLYTAAALHPKTTAAVALGGLVAGAMIWRAWRYAGER